MTAPPTDDRAGADTAATRPVPTLLAGVAVSELVLPIGLSPSWHRAVATAVRYAHRWDLPVRLVHVRTTTTDDEAPDAEVHAHRLGATYGIDVSATVLEGDAIAPAVVSTLIDGSLVILATDHVDQLTSPGSVGEAIVRATDHPVLLCGPHCVERPETGRVMVALDGSPWAETAIAPARSLAASSEATLWLVQVAPDSSVAQAERLRQEGQRVSLSAYVRAVAERLEAGGADVGWELVQGDIVGGLLQFAARRGVELIVATTHGETGLARRVLGSVAMGIVRSARTPVLIVPTDRRHAPEVP